MPRYEDAFRSALVKELTKSGSLACPIETGATMGAFPDVYFCHEFAALIELKREDCPGPNFSRKIDFRPGQYRLLSRNEALGGRSFVGVMYTNGYMFLSVKSVDPETRRPTNNSTLWLPKLDGRTILAWLKTFKP